MPLARSQPRSPPDRVSQAYEEIRDLIVRGRLAPGARIHENEAALRLGSSRTPVRAALQRLQQEGYVTGATPGRVVRGPAWKGAAAAQK